MNINYNKNRYKGIFQDNARALKGLEVLKKHLFQGVV